MEIGEKEGEIIEPGGINNVAHGNDDELYIFTPTQEVMFIKSKLPCKIFIKDVIYKSTKENGYFNMEILNPDNLHKTIFTFPDLGTEKTSHYEPKQVLYQSLMKEITYTLYLHNDKIKDNKIIRLADYIKSFIIQCKYV
jgi:hypothetical protein